MSQVRGRASWSALLLLLLAVPILARAEAPSRDELRRFLLLTRRSFYHMPWEQSYGGIWRLDPATLEYRRLRPFLATYTPRPNVNSGTDTFLTAHGDTLTVRTWPGLVDFDALSWRMLNRRPASAVLAEVGWAVQGPTLSIEDAATLGLAPGTYGIPRCVRGLIVYGPDDPHTCDPSAFPGLDGLDEHGSDAFVLWRAPPPDEGATELVSTLESFEWWMSPFFVHPCLSFDWARHGLWRCRPTGAVLYQVTSEGVGPQLMDHELSFPPFDSGEVELRRLFYLPAADRLFGTAMTIGWKAASIDYHFFSVEAATGDGQLLETWSTDTGEGSPVGLAALGEPPQEHVQLIPIVADAAGSNGTHWTTELWCFNPSAQAMRVRLRRVTRPDQARELVVPGHASLGAADALAWLGGGPEGDGTSHDAVVVTSEHRWGEQLVVAGRISTPDPASGGRFGHAITALPGRIGYSNHLAYSYSVEDQSLAGVVSCGVFASHVDLDLREPGRFRYNLGVVNDLDQPVRLRLTWGYEEWWEPEIGPIRPDENEGELVVPAHAVELYSLEALFPDQVRQRWAPRIAVVGDRPAAVWLSMVDDRTNDATFVPFTSFRYENDRDDDRLVIPVVAHAPGLNGSRWTTDLFGYSSSFWAGDLLAVYHPSRREVECGGASPPEGIQQHMFGEVGIPLAVWAQTLRAAGVWVPEDGYAAIGFGMVFPDVVRQIDPCSAEDSTTGALEIAVGSWFSGFSRTYTTREDGGTYGSMLPLYPPGGWPVQHFAGLEVSPGQRVNLGLFNGNGQAPITHRLLLYAHDGDLVASRELTLAPFASYQRPLELMLGLAPGSLSPGLYGLSVIPLDDPASGVEGRSWAYLSLVDNATNDPANLW